MAPSSSFLQKLVGLTVDEVIPHEFDDPLSLRFGGRWLLTIYNRFEFRHQSAIAASALDTLLGATAIGTRENESSAVVSFDDNREVFVDLSDDAYRGPEAMQLTDNCGSIVVWN